MAPLHRSFLISGIVSGAAALFVLPLHLALAGPPHAAAILVLAWMLSQWPQTLYLSQSGDLNRAIGLSSTLFACFVAGVCLLTGGSDSFALAWLLIPPVEAAFSTSRRTAIGITALCCTLLAAISFLSVPLPQFEPLPGPVRFIAVLAALIYVGMLGLRISLDRKRAQNAVQVSETRRQLISQSASEIFCELDEDGRMRILGGPVKRIFGTVPTAGGEDWLFQRLHVADRPLYLSRLSDVRHSGAPAGFGIRLRIGAARPGETGQAEYRSLHLHVRPAAGDQSSGETRRLLLSVRPLDERLQEGDPEFVRSLGESRTGRVSRSLLETAGIDARNAFSEIIAHASRLEAGGEGMPVNDIRDAACLVKEAGEAGLKRLGGVLDFMPDVTAGTDPVYGAFDLRSCLDQCRELLAQSAAGKGVGIEIRTGPDLPAAVADEKRVRQAFSFILSCMIESSGSGATVTVSGERKYAGSQKPSDLEVVLSVRNRQSSLSWSAESCRSVLDFAGELLERTGGRLSLVTTLGQGESVVVCLPVRSNPALRVSSAEAVTDIRQLAKTA
ncbi:PAS domain-containing sensor histidine kinase [Roseibium salinum]|uniref:Uncharacterized protein n=1 Tax=Roseibium salinum TaxID=1604349 RepID=A0ABT3QZI3_9HYPH|nr:PAS domain-containing sensor histidine kinase [Roseibium sp. DSM 29163]MCX2722243.1 hypothetical protein [Roseibium sp. DSM 29163]